MDHICRLEGLKSLTNTIFFEKNISNLLLLIAYSVHFFYSFGLNFFFLEIRRYFVVLKRTRSSSLGEKLKKKSIFQFFALTILIVLFGTDHRLRKQFYCIYVSVIAKKRLKTILLYPCLCNHFKVEIFKQMSPVAHDCCVNNAKFYRATYAENIKTMLRIFIISLK